MHGVWWHGAILTLDERDVLCWWAGRWAQGCSQVWWFHMFSVHQSWSLLILTYLGVIVWLGSNSFLKNKLGKVFEGAYLLKRILVSSFFPPRCDALVSGHTCGHACGYVFLPKIPQVLLPLPSSNLKCKNSLLFKFMHIYHFSCSAEALHICQVFHVLLSFYPFCYVLPCVSNSEHIKMWRHILISFCSNSCALKMHQRRES